MIRSHYRKRGVLPMAVQHAGATAHLSRHFPGYTRRVLVPGAGLSGLGFSLKPPAWLRDAFGKVVGGTTVNVPSVNIPLPGGGMITTPSTRPTVTQQAELFAANIPGGWATIAGVGLIGAFLLLKRR
jgi:hypothetical protein